MSIFSKIGSFFKNLFKKDKEEEVQPVCEDESVTSSETEAAEPVTVVETDNTLEEKEAEVCEPEPAKEEEPATDFAASENISAVAQEELEPEPAVEEVKEEEEVAPAAEFKSFAPIDEDDRAAILEIIRPIVKKANTSEAYLAYIKENDMEKKNFKCNVVDCPDFAEFIVEHINDKNKTYSIGGKETFTYEEIARMFFKAAGKEPVIKRAPVFLFSLLARAAKKKKNGKEAVIRFSKWTLTHDLVGDTIVPGQSFSEYIAGKTYLKIMNEQRLGESK